MNVKESLPSNNKLKKMNVKEFRDLVHNSMKEMQTYPLTRTHQK